ncbi:hypothetical protein JRQ81_006680 [Phrynocephalus forsythii]|uniref:Uncharacterized protein n=1 Tax=Phrynocephalus forsythii TaxID=171643 RepID=A0A9Q0XFG3_9SAUR|nr:hypothetical protein JRQ81_006680 [Phrynocephalus forsythii]
MMATRSRQVMQNGKSPKERNVWQRVLDLPMVNSACSSLWKTYTATKEVHPLMASLCGAYERGLRNATSLATWSIRPVIQSLNLSMHEGITPRSYSQGLSCVCDPQLCGVATANLLACHGLDHLERKIPALHQPVEKVSGPHENPPCKVRLPILSG